MGHYIRVLGTRDVSVPLEDINEALVAKEVPLNVLADNARMDLWAGLVLNGLDGTAICQVERNPVPPGQLGEAEIREFLQTMDHAKPATAAKWLKDFLPTVKVIYAIQILQGSELSYGWDAIGAIRETILQHIGGIMQADWEGFSNEEGYHVLWQFSDGVTGKWWMAVLDEAGEWIKFQIDLGNRDHRRAFLAGKVPEGVVRGG